MKTHNKLLLGSALSAFILGGCASDQVISRIDAVELQAGAADRRAEEAYDIAVRAQAVANEASEVASKLDDEHDSGMEQMRAMKRKMDHMRMKMHDKRMKHDMMK